MPDLPMVLAFSLAIYFLAVFITVPEGSVEVDRAARAACRSRKHTIHWDRMIALFIPLCLQTILFGCISSFSLKMRQQLVLPKRVSIQSEGLLLWRPRGSKGEGRKR